MVIPSGKFVQVTQKATRLAIMYVVCHKLTDTKDKHKTHEAVFSVRVRSFLRIGLNGFITS